MKIDFHPDVFKALQQLPRPVFALVLRAIVALADEPRPHGCKKLVGSGHDDWRVRVGEYRIVYEINDPGGRVTIMRVAHRREVYR